MLRPLLAAIAAVVTAMLLLPAGALAAAADPIPLEANEANSRRAVETVLADPHVQARMQLDPDVRPSPAVADFSASTNPTTAALGTRWIVEFHDEADTIAEFVAYIDPETNEVDVEGGSLVVMPNESAPVIEHVAQPWLWLPLTAAFLACVWLAPGGRRGRWLLLPLVGVSAAMLVTHANVVPAAHVRSGNLALLALAVVSLAAGAAGWTWSAARGEAGAAVRARGSWLAWAAVAVGAVVLVTVGVATVDRPIDVAIASHYGAILLREGQPVYGNTLDVAGVVAHADTYGPVMYMPYIPSTWLGDEGGIPALWTGLVLLVVGALLVAAAARAHGRGAMAWAAAAWLTCPPVALGVVLGNNDIVVGLCIAAAVAALGSPLLRGVFVALAAGAKFTPIVALPAALRWRRGDARSACIAGAAAGVTLLVVFVIGLRGLDHLDAFWERVVVFQLDRDPLQSVWGLAGVPEARYLLLGGAVLVALYALWPRRAERSSMAASLLMAAPLALLLAALPFYWATYVTWLVPCVLHAACGAEPTPTADAGAVQAQVDGATTSKAMLAT